MSRFNKRLISFNSQERVPTLGHFRKMSEGSNIPKTKSESFLPDADLADSAGVGGLDVPVRAGRADSVDSAGDGNMSSTPPSPYILSRNASFTGSSSYQEDWEAFPPLDKISAFELLGNFDLPTQMEKWQARLSAQTDKVRKQRERLKMTSMTAKDRVVDEWRRRLPPPDEQLDKYRKRMRASVDRLGQRWNDTKAVTLREKISFIAGVLNIFISGYLVGAHPDKFYYWFTAQYLYFMPIRYYTYHKRGYHYFLADLCYFVNFLLLLTVWVFPKSKRLLISTYCLAYGNNAIAIAMWRNSLVFHSLDKVTSLFIHILPPVTLHCIVHLTPSAIQMERFPAVYAIRNSDPTSPEHYSLFAMMGWATIPYAVWQLSYHFLITVRRREKIAAGRPTSFTWLRKSYSKAWIGRIVLALPNFLQEPAFMMIQYSYALLTMAPCPFWFWYGWMSASFLLSIFTWSVYNGATYYIDVFGKRFQSELEQLKKEVAKMQLPSDGSTSDADNTPDLKATAAEGAVPPLSVETATKADEASARLTNENKKEK